MAIGRPAKPRAEKALSGTLQKCRDKPDKVPANFTPLTEVPEAPDWIANDSHAVAEWDRLAPLLVRDGVLAEKDLQTLANLCSVQSVIMRAFKGEYIKATGVHATYARYASALGLADGWRSRVEQSETSKPENPFEEFKQRPN